MLREKQRYLVTPRTTRFWKQFAQQNYAWAILRSRQPSLMLLLALLLSMGFVGTVAATQTSTSTNYSVTESQFGGGSAQQCSTTYCAKSTAGDSTVGRGGSATYSAQFGSNTTSDPMLEEIVTGGNQNMGVLDGSHTGTANATIKVRNYLTAGYVLQITGPPPSQGTHTLSAIWPTPSTSQQGAEQFGINMADNTAPNIGTPPLQVPSGTYSFGTVASNYGTADLFAYHDGDVVAQSLSSTGETDYTLSMIVNVSNVTPGGNYTGVFSAVAVPVY